LRRGSNLYPEAAETGRYVTSEIANPQNCHPGICEANIRDPFFIALIPSRIKLRFSGMTKRFAWPGRLTLFVAKLRVALMNFWSRLHQEPKSEARALARSGTDQKKYVP